MHTPTTTETTNAGRLGHRKINGKRGIELKREPVADKEVFTLRIPSSINAKLRAMADEIGVSQNTLMLMLINLGTKGYDKISDLLRTQ